MELYNRHVNCSSAHNSYEKGDSGDDDDDDDDNDDDDDEDDEDDDELINGQNEPHLQSLPNGQN